MRYLPLTETDRAAMLDAIGAPSVDALFCDVPADQYLDAPVEGLPLHASEMAVEKHMRQLSKKNLAAADAPFFLGAGAYRHHVPASVDHLIQRGEFLTAYTPYQPEIAQGTLQMLFEFQTQVARLYGCAVANASMYDGSTACWEAVAMAGRVTRKKRVVLSGALHPHYAEVVRTMAKFTVDEIAGAALSLTALPDDDGLIARIDDKTSCVVVQYPDILGRIPDLPRLAEATHAARALLIVVNTEPVALGALESPGDLGADIVVGEGQSIGVGLQFGGPYLGLFAIADPKLARQMPGRLCGETVDADGKRGFVLTLSTREQHIRREKGLTALAAENHRLACIAADRLAQLPGVNLLNENFFNEFTLMLGVDARPVVRKLASMGVLGGVGMGKLFPDSDEVKHGLLVTVTETVSEDDIARLASALEEVLP